MAYDCFKCPSIVKVKRSLCNCCECSVFKCHFIKLLLYRLESNVINVSLLSRFGLGKQQIIKSVSSFDNLSVVKMMSNVRKLGQRLVSRQNLDKKYGCFKNG